MAIRFAGSRFLDERRRRRLASESGDGYETASDPTDGRRTADTLRVDEPPRNVEAGALSYRRLISPRLWKHFGLSCLGCLLAAAILAAGYYEGWVSAVLGPGIGRLFSLSTARVVTCFNSVSLLLAAQIALLIYWVRSKSLRDFVGRYRIWAWTAVAWTLFAASVATDAHLAFSETVLWLWDVPFWQKQILCWLFPAALGGWFVLRWLNRDMCGCRTSLSLLWLATAGYLFASLLKLEVVTVAIPSTGLALTGTFMFASLFLFLSMLLHARHVIYESCETPDNRPSLITTRVRRLVQAVSSDRSLRPQSAGAAAFADSAAESVTAADADEIADRVNRDAEQDQELAKTPETTDHEEAAEPSADASVDQVAPEPTTLDDPDVAEVVQELHASKPDLKGLSKKQRRRLRKQHRQEQHSAAR